MAYQNVGTPRFYMNVPEFLHNIGAISIPPVLMTLPVLADPNGYGAVIDAGKSMNSGKNFIAMLNCPKSSSMNVQSTDGYGVSLSEIINGGSPPVEFDGFRIATFDTTVESFNVQGTAGSIIVGNYYDMPHSPELSLSLNYSFGGINTQETIGGSTLSNANFIKPADWGNAGAWQLGSTEDGQPYSNLRNGRRIYNLSFNYLNDSDLMPPLGVQRYDVYSDPERDVLDGLDLFSQVINRSMLGHLPFIFQPDNSNNSADQFCIAKFDMNTLEYKQVANNVYNISLTIREVW